MLVEVNGKGVYETIDIVNAGDEDLIKISRLRQLALNLDEMRKIKNYFQKLGRNPTDVELETIAQTWSEHCAHKTFKSTIIYEENGKREEVVLFKFIKDVTKELNYPWLFSVFEDNAGIVDFKDDYAIAFKVETHNHPSAIEPFGGAATGVGGVIRDILGVWGEPIACTNVLCFGNLDYSYTKLPKGIKHPKFIFTYVVAGIGSYGNNFGIPNVNGAIIFDEGYVGNPLVYCGCIGIVKKSRYARKIKAGDCILIVGGRTGRDGLHGVTFASTELSEDAEEVFYTAVQIGDPIEEEKIKRAVLAIRDKGLASGITDLGGGGLSSAICEQAHNYGLGAVVHLDRVHLKFENMKPWEIWISESQERMLIAVPKENLKEVCEILESEDVEFSNIGEFTGDKKIRIFFNGIKVAELDVDFLFDIPKRNLKAVYKPNRNLKEPKIKPKDDYSEDILNLIAMPNIASREPVVRTYDHEVKAMTIIKPYMVSPSDAAVLKPLYDSWQGIVVSNGINEYGKIDTYHMAASAIDEAIRNNIAVGGRRIALLDNFCWGSPENEENLAKLVRAAKACYEVAKAYGVPFISGKDSLYNESVLGSVNPTLLISALGIIPDVRKAVTSDFKESGSMIYILGTTRDELGGSQYYKMLGYLGKNVPKVYPDSAKRTFEKLTEAIDMGIVSACHDISDGGLAIALAEMCFSGIGAEISLERVPTDENLEDYKILFSESNSRFIVEVKEKYREEFEEVMKGSVFSLIGRTKKEKIVEIKGRNSRTVLEIKELKENWEKGLERYYEKNVE